VGHVVFKFHWELALLQYVVVVPNAASPAVKSASIIFELAAQSVMVLVPVLIFAIAPLFQVLVVLL
jgi:hypothetical protein